jgi:hypothetical protein
MVAMSSDDKSRKVSDEPPAKRPARLDPTRTARRNRDTQRRISGVSVVEIEIFRERDVKDLCVGGYLEKDVAANLLMRDKKGRYVYNETEFKEKFAPFLAAAHEDTLALIRSGRMRAGVSKASRLPPTVRAHALEKLLIAASKYEMLDGLRRWHRDGGDLAKWLGLDPTIASLRALEQLLIDAREIEMLTGLGRWHRDGGDLAECLGFGRHPAYSPGSSKPAAGKVA